MWTPPRTHEEYLESQCFENNHGLLQSMTPAEVGGFHRMLKRLRKELNKLTYFEELLHRGIKQLNLRQATRVLTEEGSFSHVAYRWDRTKVYEPLCSLAGEEARRRGLELLRDTLNDKIKFAQLACLGPYSISIDFWQTESEAQAPDFDFMSHLDLLIQNHIPACIPNADWSIDAQTGTIYYHS